MGQWPRAKLRTASLCDARANHAPRQGAACPGRAVLQRAWDRFVAGPTDPNPIATAIKNKHQRPRQVGDRVESNYEDGEDYYPATVTRSTRGSYHLLYDDGDREANVPAARLRRLGRPPRGGGSSSGVDANGGRVEVGPHGECRCVFVYGSLRPDFSADGDAWGMSQGAVWEAARVSGFSLHQQHDEFFPFALRGETDQTLRGFVLSWPGRFQEGLKECDDIEGEEFTRITVMATVERRGVTDEIPAYLYHTTLSHVTARDSQVAWFPEGDWLAPSSRFDEPVRTLAQMQAARRAHLASSTTKPGTEVLLGGNLDGPAAAGLRVDSAALARRLLSKDSPAYIACNLSKARVLITAPHSLRLLRGGKGTPEKGRIHLRER